MKKVVFQFSLIENDMMNTYEVTSSDLTELEEELKEFGKENIVELSATGPYGVVENALLRDVKRFGDEILEINIKYGEPLYKGYGSPLKVTLGAIVKDYPVLYHVIFRNNDQNYIQRLIAYLQKSDFDSNITENEKVELIKKFMNGLQYKCVNRKLVSDIKEEIDFVSSMNNSLEQSRLLNTLKGQYAIAQSNTECFKKLNQRLNQEKDVNKVYKK